MDCKIYKLICSNPDLIYFGSTTQSLDRRLTSHNTPSNKSMAKLLYEYGGVEIELLETCGSKEEMLKIENHYISNYECVNKKASIPNPLRNKQYYEKNREAVLVLAKKYNQDNNEAINIRKKEYRQLNKEELSIKWKEYYEKNKEEICVRKTEKITCECGRTVRKDSITRHRKFKVHLNNI